VTRLSSILHLRPLPAWLSTDALGAAIIVTAVLGASWLFLWPSYLEFPMDDTYIHFVYAQNLAEQGSLAFNAAGEKGVGTTSVLWVLLLAGGHALGVSMHWLAKVLGVASLAVVGVGLYSLLRTMLHPPAALLGALLVALSGNMLWFALSGMETVLFLALGTLALLAYSRERWAWLGVALGLLVLTRPEGLALAVAIAAVHVWQSKGVGRGLFVSGLICALICGPWFGYLWWRTGHVIPTSAVGKQLSSTIGIRLTVERNASLALLGRFPSLIYPALWAVYMCEFVLGGMALPPPRIPIGAVAGNPHYTLSLWAIVGWIGVVLPLLWMAGRRVGPPGRWLARAREARYRPWPVFALWVVLHNVAYMLFLPIPGTASRYGALNHVALWLLLAVGLSSVFRRPRLWPWLAAGLGVLAIVNTLYWNGVYDANLDHMQRARIAAARYVRDHLSPTSGCAAFDIGAMRYYSQRQIVDLGGLVDPDAGQWFLAGACDRYLVDRGVEYVVLPGRSGVRDEGWFDFAAIMGLTTSPLFEMDLVAVFEIDDQRWLRGYLPTGNYQASVAIYRLLAKD
jgi:hypothetical protein